MSSPCDLVAFPHIFPGLDKIMQGYTESSNSEFSLYDHSQPSGLSPSTTQECFISPASSSMALFAHHTQAAANPNHVSTLTSGIDQVSHGAINGSQNPETSNQMALSGSQDRPTLPPANQPARRRRKLINLEIVLEMVKKQGMLMFTGGIVAVMGFAKSTVAATLQTHNNCGPLPRRSQLEPILHLIVKKPIPL
ncbi:hypothetical protein DSO57_1018117 [Entomophthora muscae]|uniref:Uncharacterized protein n=1 Tax=Entomophthora muscae TaxID=34485 RepID=A0ACC2SH30_9FUNG|nr:hypothetical protein DSO57_1018117 [Entomophthora muscae]